MEEEIETNVYALHKYIIFRQLSFVLKYVLLNREISHLPLPKLPPVHILKIDDECDLYISQIYHLSPIIFCTKSVFLNREISHLPPPGLPPVYILKIDDESDLDYLTFGQSYR